MKREEGVGRITYTGRQDVVPRPPLAGHALEDAAAVQGVALVAAERDGAAGKVALVADFEAELRHAGVVTVGQLEAWTEESEEDRVREALMKV